MKTSTFILAAAAGSASAATVQSAYGQCGGQGWTGPTSCVAGYYCASGNQYYAQCTPGSAPATSAAATSAKTTAAAATTKASSAATTAKTSSAAAATSAAVASSGKVQFAGVNIAGFDFGCGTDGTCTVSGAVNVATTGTSQMNHFVKDTKLNAFRLPVGWQYLVNGQLGGTLDSTNFANYNSLVTGCLNSGAALCIVDVHNYARWNGAIIGQGGPTNAQFSSLWSQLATKYANNNKIAFGIMNEPHDLVVSTWATTVQAAVTAIRQAGAKSNLILLPGSDYTHALSSVSDGSYAALGAITNLDGTKTNLVYDFHQYLDSDGSGTHSNCVTNNVDGFNTLATQLRKDGRQGIITEFGGGPNDSSCLTDVCQMLEGIAKNSDVYLGWTGWAAGGFDTSYVLAETPSGSAGSYVDQPLVSQCVAGAFLGTANA